MYGYCIVLMDTGSAWHGVLWLDGAEDTRRGKERTRCSALLPTQDHFDNEKHGVQPRIHTLRATGIKQGAL